MNIGIDIGGSHVGVGLVNESGKVIDKIEKDLFQNEKLAIESFLVEFISESINRLITKNNDPKIEKIGISAPGSCYNGHLRNVINLGIHDLNIEEKLIDALRSYNIEIEKISVLNDGKCSAIAEKEYGVLQNYNNCIYLCLGTGIGGGAFANGKLLLGKENPGFEIGHITIKKDGIECKCGSKGCFEAYASMRVFKENICSELQISNEISGKELLTKINNILEVNNNTTAKIEKVIDQYITDVSIGLANLINIFEPEAIALGGSFCYYKEIFIDKLNEKLTNSEFLYNKDKKTKLLISTLGSNAGIIGAQLYA